MGDKMIIREANMKDLQSIAKVHVDSSRTTYRGTIPDDYLDNLSYESKSKYWQESLFSDNRSQFMYIAETDDKNLVGFASAGLARTNDYYERELYKIYILKEFQRKGTGKLLMKAIVRKLLDEDIKSMILWALEDNPSRLFYDNLGGKIVDKRFIQRGEKEFIQVAYVWEDITSIL